MGIGASRSATDLFELSGRDGTLYASVSGDNAFHIKGINWFGSETYCGPPGGLDRHPVGFYLDFLQRHKFNAIRLLFAHEFIEKDDIVHTAESEDPLFFQTRYLEMFTILCREAATNLERPQTPRGHSPLAFALSPRGLARCPGRACAASPTSHTARRGPKGWRSIGIWERRTSETTYCVNALDG